MTKKAAVPADILQRLVNKAKKRQDIVIRPDSTFKDLQIDSLEVVSIIIALEDELGIEIDDRDLRRITNMGAFIGYLENKMTKKQSLSKG